MSVLLYSFLATFAVSLVSFAGALTFLLNAKRLNRFLILLIGLAAGTMIGGAFIHLIPEAVEEYNHDRTFLYVLAGFSAFFAVERLLHWHHCHQQTRKDHVHTFTYMTLIGDTVHNFLDGVFIAVSFATDIRLGVATTVAVIMHEIPQEISDVGVMVYGGFSKRKALFFNFLTALAAVAGALAGYFLTLDNFMGYILPFIAGGFLYVGASDLIPELHKEQRTNRSFYSFVSFLVGLIIMYYLRVVFEG